MVSNLDAGNSCADRLDDTGALMTEDNWESTLGILARQCECVYSR